SKSNQPVGDDLVFIGVFGLIMVGAFADAKRLAGQADAGFKAINRTPRHLFASRWRYHFFRSASCTISAFRRSSAYIFLSCLFSVSSSFRRAIIEVSRPPYLARHL